MEKERGIVCMFCGKGFGYVGEKPDDETMNAAINHEKVCPKNPYIAEIAKLAARVELLESVVKAQARLLVAYRVGGKPPEWVFDTIDKARASGVDV